MCTQYNKDLDGALDEMKDYLVKAERSLTNARTFHPKVAATYKCVRTWQPQPSSLVSGGKILVMVFRGFQEVSKSLMSQFQQFKGHRTTTIERKSSLFPLLNDAHVVICDPANIPDNFPWSAFVLFISYEDKIEWLSKILFGKPIKAKKFIHLKGISSQGEQNISECNIGSIEGKSIEFSCKLNLKQKVRFTYYEALSCCMHIEFTGCMSTIFDSPHAWKHTPVKLATRFSVAEKLLATLEFIS